MMYWRRVRSHGQVQSSGSVGGVGRRALVRVALLGVVLGVACGSWPVPLFAQAPEATPADPAGAAATEGAATGAPTGGAAGEAEASLAAQQEQVRRRFKRFEETLLKLSTSLRKTDPDRAVMLDRAKGKINEERFDTEMLDLGKLLGSKPLGDSVLERQDELITRLQTLLELLQSEDRQKEIAKEKERIADLIKDVNKLIGEQKGARQLSEGGPTDKARDAQEKVAKKTGDVLKKIDGQDAEKKAAKEAEAKEGQEAKSGDPMDAKPAEGDPSETEPKPGDPKDGKPSDGKPKDGKPKDGKKPEPGDKPGEPQEPSESSPSEPSPSEAEPSESKPSESKPAKPSASKPSKPSQGGQSSPPMGESEPGEQPEGESEQSEQTPGREQLEEARQEMEKAIEDLQQKQPQKAGEKQDEALRKLIAAKEKLEEILRQLREEERGRRLAALEARFQRMLAMELKVYDGTVRLGKIPTEVREPRHRALARDLASQQDEVDLEASKTLNLLREEGTAVAFKEAVEQMREDMRLASKRLAQEDAGDLTQAVEKDIIDALQEMIAALQKEMEKQEQQKPQEGQQPSQPQEPGLLDKIAELKMLKSLQVRVNQRTKRLGAIEPGEQAVDRDLLDQLRGLSERQARIQRAAYDLATGRNE
jgi:hypothetical protein